MHSGFTLSRFSVFTVERPSLDQFVLLSLMLHVLVIVLFGDAAGGGARRGEKLWGALTVTVRSLLPEPGVALKLDRASTTLQWPATVPQPAPTLPGIAPEKLDRRASEATQQASPVEETAPPAQAPSFEMPPLISKDVEKPVTEFVVPKPSADRAYTPPTAQAPREAPATPPPVIAPAVIPPPVFVAPAAEPIAPIKVERASVAPLLPINPAELKPREELVAPPTPAPEPLPPRMEREIVKPIISAPAPRPRDVVPPVVQPAAPAPSAPVTPIAPAVLPKPERENVQPVAVPAEAKPREIPAAAPPAPPALSEPPQRAEAPKTPKVEREIVTPVAPPVAIKTAPPGATNADNDILKARGEAARALIDTPGLAAPPAPGKAPGIDLDAVRRRARELGSDGTGPRTVFPFPVAPPPKPKSKEQQAFDKALKKSDCRDAYADMGLAAIVPLALDAVREGGCKW